MYSPIQITLPTDYTEETLNTFLKDRGLLLKKRLRASYKLELLDILTSRVGITGTIYNIQESEESMIVFTIFSRDAFLRPGVQITTELMNEQFILPITVKTT